MGMMPILSMLTVALSPTPCARADKTDLFRLWRLDALPGALVPGSSACLEWHASPLVSLDTGWSVHVRHGLLGDFDYEACDTEAPKRLASNGAVQCPTAPATNVSGKLCLMVPLAAVVHAGESTELVLSWADGAGSPAVAGLPLPTKRPCGSDFSAGSVR